MNYYAEIDDIYVDTNNDSIDNQKVEKIYYKCLKKMNNSKYVMKTLTSGKKGCLLYKSKMFYVYMKEELDKYNKLNLIIKEVSSRLAEHYDKDSFFTLKTNDEYPQLYIVYKFPNTTDIKQKRDFMTFLQRIT